MKKICIIGILTLLLLIPVSSAIDIQTDMVNDNIKIYKFAKIRTTGTTGGYVFCFPGYLRSVFLNGCTLLHSYIAYQDNYWEGWYLTIGGDRVPRGRGFIFGFTGQIRNLLLFGFNPDYEAFDLEGFALRVIHISD